MDTRALFDELSACSAELDLLARHSILPTISLGIRDAEGGYGWFTVLCVDLVAIGEKCRCGYDTTDPTTWNTPLWHRHSWSRIEKNIGFWRNFPQTMPLKEYLNKVIEEQRIK